jgi:hypothetical protein
LSLNVNVTEGDCSPSLCTNVQRNPVIHDPTIAFRSSERVRQHFGGCQDVIEQPDLAKIEVKRQVKSKKIILQSVGGKGQKLDLALYREAGAGIIDLLDSQLGLRQ